MALRKRKQADGPDPDSSRFTPKRAKNALGVAKVIGPAVIPVIAPYVLKAVGQVRDRIDRAKARKLGVPVDDLAKYTGKGGALQARISGLADAVTELRSRRNLTKDDTAFADRTDTTLRQLAAAVRAAERMPSARRRAAHHAVAAELDQLEESLLARLGV